jgi:hypothetical protein
VPSPPARGILAAPLPGMKEQLMVRIGIVGIGFMGMNRP